MLRTVKTDRYSIIVEEFRSIQELVATNSKRSRVHNAGYTLRSEFNGFSKYEDALEMLASGYTEPVKDIMANVAKIDRKKTVEEKRKPRRFESVEGYAPIVPNALRGLPNSMVNHRMTSKKTKVLNVLIDGTFVAGVTKFQMNKHYSEVIAHLISLEKQGFRIRLSMVFQFGLMDGKKSQVMTLLLKDERQPFDIKKMMFPMVHFGFFRTVGFEWYFRVPGSSEFPGFGNALYQFSGSRRKEILDGAFGDIGKYYYVMFGDNIQDIMKGAK